MKRVGYTKTANIREKEKEMRSSYDVQSNKGIQNGG